MNILLVALEFAPFFEESPAAESISSLSKALRLLGHDVTAVVPRLSVYEEAGVMAARQLTPLELGDGRTATLFEAQLPSGVKLVQAEEAAQRFTADQPLHKQSASLGSFSLAVAAYVRQQELQGAAFETVHCHDAGAGLALLKLGRFGATDLARVLTVHDAARSGEFEKSAGEELGIPAERLGAQGFGSAEGICLLKGLVSESDVIVTPSDSYGRQLQAPEKHGALARAFQAATVVGVIEGVDQALYNPATDAALANRYDGPDPKNKGRNKSSVLGDLGLALELSRPVVFVEDVPFGDCAFDTLVRSLPAIVRNDLALVIVGAVEEREKQAEMLKPFESQVCWLKEVSQSQRRRILAASDFYLSIQRRDPSGQRLLQAARYGTIPIALRVDATMDVIVDCDAELRTGTGILYDSLTQRGLTSATARAVSAYHSGQFQKLLGRIMRQDLAWDRAARRHVLIYKQALEAQA